MTSTEPTKKQKLILDFIESFIYENNKSPSYREIASGVGLSSIASVAEHIDNLVEKGYLIKNPGAARSLEIIKSSDFEETKQLFREKYSTATASEREILKKSAIILNLGLDFFD